MTEATDMRTLMLDRIRRARTDIPSDERPEDVVVPRDYRGARPSGAATRPDERRQLVDRFAERAADYRAVVARAVEHEVPGLVAKLLAQQAVNDLVVPDGFPERHLAAAVAIAPLRDEPPLSASALDAAHAVITTCALAVADTGTIVLDAGPGQGRRALTLLPDYHLCLVPADRIVATVPDAIARIRPTRPLTLISGPSATSDIENDRVEGVHGPRTLHIIVVEHETDPT